MIGRAREAIVARSIVSWLVWVMDQFPHPARVQSSCAPTRDGARALRIDPAPPGPSRALIEPTWPRLSRWTPHSHNPARLSHFHGSLIHFDKASAISQFSVNHFSYSAQPFLLQCSSILDILLGHFCDFAAFFLSHFVIL
jgi:hypothetical protein